MAERNLEINTADFPGNSNKSKEEPVKPKVDKVVSGKVEKRKPSFIQKAAGVIFSDINEEDLKSEIIFDYLVPTIKDTIVDMSKMLLDAVFYGTTTHKKSSSGNRPYKVSYSDYYDRGGKPTATNTKSSSYHFDEVTLDSRADAEQVLDNLIDLIREYGSASVGDFCDLVGVDSNFTDYKYGWNDLTRTTISRTRNGYIIDFPKPGKLD